MRRPPRLLWPSVPTRPSSSARATNARSIRRRAAERDVDVRLELRAHVAPVKRRARPERVADGARLRGVQRRHRLEPADATLEPPQREQHDVDREDGRRVQDRPRLDVRSVVEDRRQTRRRARRHVVADENDGDSRGAQVLLRVREDQAVGPDVDGARQKVRGHVADERRRRLRPRSKLQSLDGLVRHVKGVRRLRVRAPIAGGGETAESRRPTVPRHANRAVVARGLGGLLAPVPADDVVGDAAAPEHRHRDHRELERAAALEKEDVNVRRNIEEAAQPLVGLVEDAPKERRPVAETEDRRSRAGDREDRLLHLAKDLHGEGPRPRREVAQRRHRSSVAPMRPGRRGVSRRRDHAATEPARGAADSASRRRVASQTLSIGARRYDQMSSWPGGKMAIVAFVSKTTTRSCASTAKSMPP